MAQEGADQELKVQLELLRSELAKRQSEIDEKDRKIAEKDRANLILLEEKQTFRRELISDLEEALKTLSDVSEQVLDLTKDFQKFQNMRGNFNGEETTTPRAGFNWEMPLHEYENLSSAKEDVAKMIANAQSELAKAAEAWKKAQAGLEVMEAFNRKRILAAVLGKEEPVEVMDLT